MVQNIGIDYLNKVKYIFYYFVYQLKIRCIYFIITN